MALIPLDDYNADMKAAYARDAEHRTGLACPTCQTELLSAGPVDYDTKKYPVMCPKRSCPFTGHAYV